MVKIHDSGVFLKNGREIVGDPSCGREDAAHGTMAWPILRAHNTAAGMDKLRIRFDAMASHDITYVGIVQTARASGLEKFPIPYVLTNCHNSLCAVGGTINEDDHMFGLSAAQKYGGIYVPAHQAVIHQYMREMMSACGGMILGSDSHTRYGALGCMAVGEGGPELVKQLLGRTYDIDMPEIVAVRLSGKPRPGVGPQDIALALIGAVFGSGFVKNKVLEFVGDGIANLSADDRIGVDVMTTETTCLSSIWETDGTIRDYYEIHGREGEFRELHPAEIAYYDGMVDIDLAKVEPMIALPFHPSNVYTIRQLKENLEDILVKVERDGQKRLENPAIKFSLRDKIKNGELHVQQGVIAGCAGGTFENLCAAADILGEKTVGSGEFSFSVYPSSQPVNLELVKNGTMAKLMRAGAIVRTAFCGPCFGAGDVPANGGLSVRHSTRNFPNREGSKPGNGQISSVALMDARSIAATAGNGGRLTAADEFEAAYTKPRYFFDRTVYENRCYFGFGNARPETPLKFGPGIADWPAMRPLAEDLLLKVVTVIHDPVTTTDELIPSGETSSFRSNPLGLAQYTLSRKDPAYVPAATAVQALENLRLDGNNPAAADPELAAAIASLNVQDLSATGIGSAVYAVKPGDGSAREQAASCQKVLGTFANLAREYATKRYRSNLINWGMLPFVLDGEVPFPKGTWLYVPGIRRAVAERAARIPALYSAGNGVQTIELRLSALTDDEREIILAGCLINYYRAER